MKDRFISSDYYSTTDPPVGIFRPVEMSCCAARYAVDNRWYRARIKRYSAGNESLNSQTLRCFSVD